MTESPRPRRSHSEASGNPTETSPDGDPVLDPVRPVVATAVQTMVARRLARAFPVLGLLAVAGLVELVVRREPTVAIAVAAAGAPVSAVALVAQGLGIVRRTAGVQLRGLWRLARASWLLPLAYGLFLLVGRGLAGIAEVEAMAAPLWLAALYGLAGWRVLTHVGSVSETARLAAAMLEPTAGEGEGT